MTRTRILGVCLVAAFAFSALAATSALALTKGLPAGEFGECVKVAAGAGKFSTAACTAEGGEKKYEWKPLASPVSLTGEMKPETIATLETVTGTKITCKHEKNVGEIANTQEVKNVVATFTECETSKIPCENTAKEGEIVTNHLGGVTGVEKEGIVEGKLVESKDKLAQELHAEGAATLATFTCGAFTIEVKGSLLHPATAGKMTSKLTEKFSASKGEQKPSCYYEGKDTEPDNSSDNTIEHCHALESNTNGGAFEESGQTITALVTLARKVELNPVMGPPSP